MSDSKIRQASSKETACFDVVSGLAANAVLA